MWIVNGLLTCWECWVGVVSGLVVVVPDVEGC